jgi:hypothetical protein
MEANITENATCALCASSSSSFGTTTLCGRKVAVSIPYGVTGIFH